MTIDDFTIFKAVKQSESGAIARAFNTLWRRVENEVRISYEEFLQYKDALFPPAVPLSLDRPNDNEIFLQQYQPAEIFSAIDKLSRGKSAGPSGISNDHLIRMKNMYNFAPALSKYFSDVENNHNLVDECPHLYQFHLVLINRVDKMPRPIAV